MNIQAKIKLLCTKNSKVWNEKGFSIFKYKKIYAYRTGRVYFVEPFINHVPFAY